MPRLLVILAILLFSLPCAAQQQDGSVFERRVSINQNNQPLNYILEQLSWQTNVYFSYDASILNAEKIVSLEVENRSLFTVLNYLFNSNNFKFAELDNQIIISKKINNELIEVAQNDTIPIKYFFLAGKLLDNKKGDPIRYATIYVHKKPIGTISNFDGEFLLKIHPENIFDTIIISCMGYKQLILPAHKILDEDIFILKTISIKIKEVRVTATSPHELLKNIRNNLTKNYSASSKLMTAFYRETVKQDNNYINVSEAVMEILKAPYSNTMRNDVIRLIKGRKSPDVQPFQWMNFKLQGGPFSITQLDIVKTMKRFIDKDFEELYKYQISKIILYNNYPVYVLKFNPVSELVFPAFEGEMYIHRKSFAIVHAKFKLNKNSLNEAENTMITKKPRGVKAKPSYVQYTVNYQQFQEKWQLATSQTSIKIKIKSRRDKINSEFHSVTDLLVTDIQPTELKRFTRNESLSRHDVFVEMINNYDEQYWENYNIIKPNEELQKAFPNQASH